MREKVALLLITGVALATTAFSNQQRVCVVPAASVAEPSASDGEDAWTGEPATFQKAIWRLRR